MTLILPIALVLAWRHQITEEREAVRFCEQDLQGRVYYEGNAAIAKLQSSSDDLDSTGRSFNWTSIRQAPDPPTPGPQWLRDWIGDEPFRTPIAAEIGDVADKGYSSEYKDLTDADLARACRLRSLRFLRIHSTQITGAGLTSLEQLPSLEWLFIIGNFGRKQAVPTGNFGRKQADLTASDLAHLRRLPRLKHLAIEGKTLTGDALAELGKLERLESLNLEFATLPPSDLAWLRGMRSLRRLEGLTRLEPRDDDMQHLAPLESLESVDLTGTEITGDGLAHLGALRSLKRLSLGYCPIRDDDLSHLANHPQLEWLDLSGTQVAGPGLEHLRRLHRLKHLTFASFSAYAHAPDSVPLAAEAIPHLAALPALEVLYLDPERARKLGIGPVFEMASGRELRELLHGYYKVADAP